MSQTVRDLTSARDKIAQGWTQGAEMSSDGGKVYFCSIGALRYAILESIRPLQMHFRTVQYRMEFCCQVVSSALTELYPDLTDYDVIDWNDSTGRTQDQVVEAFDRAIKIAERDLG